MKPRSMACRRFSNILVNAFSGISALLGLFFLVWILYEVISRGMEVFSFALITDAPKPIDEGGGGFANAILGTLLMTGFAAITAIPMGLLTGVFLSEFGRDSWIYDKVAGTVRFATTILLGTPSIIVGVFAYSLLVKPWLFGVGYKGLAGAFSLFIIMFPVIVKTTEDMLALVPNALRESALALGMPKWKMTFSIIFRASKNGLVTGILLALARVSGETAPLLFTAGDSQFFFSTLKDSVANLTVKIYTYSTCPNDLLNKLGWAGAFLITIAILTVNIISRIIFRDRKVK